MQFDLVIRLGDLLLIFSILAGGITAFALVKFRLDRVEVALEKATASMVEEAKKMSQALIDIARTQERLDAMDRRIDDLQHGRGFILEHFPTSIRSGPVER